MAVAKIVVAALIGALWAGRRLRQTYFYFDEWSMIGRVIHLGVIEGATTSFNGHLWFFQDMIFRVQARVFGLDSNGFLVVVFISSLVALHLALAALAVRIGVPLTPALMLAGLLTYLGPAAQNFVFAIQVSPTFATAAAVGAAAVVLGGTSTTRRYLAVGGLLQLAALFDSGVGLLALALVGGVVIGLWPRGSWWVLAPSALIIGIWYAFGDLGPKFEASVADRIVFAARLLLRGGGSLVGGGAWVGIFVVIVFASSFAVAFAAGRLDRTALTVMFAAGVATMVNVAGIAQSRAGLPGFTFFENNRYLQNVAIPLTITFLPALVACAGLVRERWQLAEPGPRAARDALPMLVIAACFGLGLGAEADYAEVFIDRTEQVRTGVRDIAIVENTGCPSGQMPNLDARPLGALSPQVSTRLVAELVDRELLSIEPGRLATVDPEILRAICGP